MTTQSGVNAIGLEREITRSSCSAEDLIVLKAFADRPQDWIDVEGIIVRQRDALQRDLVRANCGSCST